MRMVVLLSAALAFLGLFAACPQAETGARGQMATAPAPAKSSAGQATDVAAAPPVPVPKGAEFARLTTSDGWGVAAWYWKPKGKASPAVICLHMRGKDKSSFTTLAQVLLAQGYAVIAIDLRGHGETLDPGGRSRPLDHLTDADYLGMVYDVAAAHAYLAKRSEVDASRVAIIGASIGANLGIIYAAGEPRVRTVVALSPGEDYHGLKPLPYLDDYDGRALYLIAAKGDEYSRDCCLRITQADAKAEPLSYREFAGKAHGTDLLTANPGLDATIVNGWLLNHLPPAR